MEKKAKAEAKRERRKQQRESAGSEPTDSTVAEVTPEDFDPAPSDEVD